MTPRKTKILVSPVWIRIVKIWDTLFELIKTNTVQRKEHEVRTLVTWSNKSHVYNEQRI